MANIIINGIRTSGFQFSYTLSNVHHARHTILDMATSGRYKTVCVNIDGKSAWWYHRGEVEFTAVIDGESTYISIPDDGSDPRDQVQMWTNTHENDVVFFLGEDYYNEEEGEY